MNQNLENYTLDLLERIRNRTKIYGGHFGSRQATAVAEIIAIELLNLKEQVEKLEKVTYGYKK